MVIVNREILWGCCTFLHSKVNIGLTSSFLSTLPQLLTVFPKLLLRLKEELKQTSNYPPLVILRNCQIKSLKLTLWLLPFTSFCVPEICADFLMLVLMSFHTHLHFVQVVLVNARLAQEGLVAVCELLVQSFIVLLSGKAWFDSVSLH